MKLPKWFSSVLVVIGSAAFLAITLRGLGPSGPGVPDMLQMQSAWRSLPAIHAMGAILHESGGRRDSSRFELWEGGGVNRRLQFTGAGPLASALYVVTARQAWKQSAPGGPVQELDPDRVDLFPVPDPDAPDNTFYRTARRWDRRPPALIGGRPCTHVVGSTGSSTFDFYLDPLTHLPRRVVLQGGTPVQRWTVDFLRIGLPFNLPASLFTRPTPVKR